MDFEGRQAQMSTKQVEAPAKAVNCEYDDLGRMTGTYTDNTETGYTYDQVGRLKTVGVYERNNVTLATPEITTYTYDLVGNLDLVEQSNGVVADYQYDALNRLELLEHFVDEDGDHAYDTGDEDLRLRAEPERSMRYVLWPMTNASEGTFARSSRRMTPWGNMA